MPPGKEDLARTFFGAILGMKEAAKPFPLSERGGCWFRSGEVILHIGVENKIQPQRKAHLAFVMPDLAALATKLTAQNLPANWDTALPDRTRFYSTDPFGNRI